jgi:hypothetical protein
MIESTLFLMADANSDGDDDLIPSSLVSLDDLVTDLLLCFGLLSSFVLSVLSILELLLLVFFFSVEPLSVAVILLR